MKVVISIIIGVVVAAAYYLVVIKPVTKEQHDPEQRQFK